MQSTSIESGTTEPSKTTVQVAENLFYQDVRVEGKAPQFDRTLLNPAPDLTPHALLGKRREILNILIDRPTYPNCEIEYYYPLDEILFDNQVRSLINTFTGMRFDIRLVITITAPPGWYGLLTVHRRYGKQEPVTETSWFGRSDLFTTDTYTMSVSSSEALEMVYPFIYPADYMKLGSTDEYINYCSLTFCLHALESISTIPSALRIVVQGSLENVDLIQPNDALVPYPPPALSQVHMQALASPAVAGAVGLFAMGAQSIISAKESYDTTMAVIDNVTELGQQVVDRIDEVKVTTNDSQRIKPAETGKVTSVRQNVFGSVSQLNSPSPIDTVAECMPMYRATSPHFGECIDSLALLSQRPGWKYFDRILSNQSSGTIQFQMPIYGGNVLQFRNLALETQQYSWATYLCNFFRYYRGKHKIRIQAITSSLVTCLLKFRIYYVPSGEESQSYAPSEEVPSVTMFIRGDTELTLSVPYMDLKPYYTPEQLVAVITCEIVSPPQQFEGKDTGVYLLCTHSLDDAEYFSLRGYPVNLPGALTEGEPTSEVHTSLTEAHAMMDIADFGLTGPPAPSRHYMPQTRYISSMLKRWSTRLGTLSQPLKLTELVGVDDLTSIPGGKIADYTLLEQMMFMFYIVSGSMEKKVRYSEQGDLKIELNQDASLISLNQFAGGTVFTTGSVWPQLEYVMPFVSDYGAVFTSNRTGTGVNNPEVVGVSGNGVEPTNVVDYILRGGQDLRFFHPNRLPTTSFWN